MDVLDIINQLEENEVYISLDGSDLDVSFMQEEISDDILKLLKANKKLLVDYLSALQNSEQYESIPVIEIQESYPLSSSQMRMWILSQFDEASLAYNLPFTIDLKGNYDVSNFMKAMDATIAKHEILRTVFKENEAGEVRQWIIPSEKFNFLCQWHDLSASADALTLAEKMILEDSYAYFDLENGPLLRAAFFKLNDEEYKLYYNMHHIISDGWSMKVLTNDTLAYYSALQNDTQATDLPLRIQYKDYTTWQQNQLQEGKFDKEKYFWVDVLNKPLPILTLPTSKKRPEIKTYSGRKLKTYISSETTEKLKSFSKTAEGSLFSTLISTWNILFYQYTQEHDFIVATPSAGRFHSDLENQIGFYANTLVLRNQLDPEADFITTYNTINDNTLAALNHQNYPFDELIENVGIKRDTSRNAIFDVMISLQSSNENPTATQQAKKEESIIDLGDCYSKFDIEVNFYEEDGQLALVIDYNKDVYENSMIHKMLQHYKMLVHELLQNPHQKIKNISLLSAEEKQLLIHDFNNTEVTYAKKTIVDLFEAQAQRTPENVAIRYNETTYSYAELDKLSNQLGRYLVDKYAVETNDLVGIHLERSEKMPLAIMGILKANAGYIPLGTDYPVERVSFIKKDAALKVILDEAEISQFFSMRSQYATDTIEIERSIENIAYCIYTSGSTGNPKGVLNQHSGLSNHLLWMQEYLQTSTSDMFLQKTPYTFDVSVSELLLPFLTGSCLVMAKPDGHKDSTYLKEIICKEKISIIHFVPSMLDVFLQNVKNIEENIDLKHIICIGEELPARMVTASNALFKHTRIHNLYGPAEAAIVVTGIDVTDADITTGVSIGKPSANTRIYIVDEGLHPQPIGIPGELLISGVQVAKGYLNLPELTEEKFIADPFIDGERVYKTGDIASWNKDGTIQFIGRKDNQVKIRGNRIELGEIDTVLSRHKNVKQVAAAAKDSNGEKVLVAYIVPKDENSFKKSEIRAYLTQSLPAYMVPDYYIILEELPLNTSGKIDRKQLPEITEGDVIKNEYQAPTNDFEKTLVQIWEEVLGIEKIGMTDNFFDLGGHSLRAGRLINLYGRAFSVKLKIKDVFIAKTVKDHADLIQGAALTKFKAIEKAPELENYPLSEAQYMMWLDSVSNKGMIAYNVSIWYTFHESYNLDVDIFLETQKELALRHETLRTVFKKDENDEIRQWIIPIEDVVYNTRIEDISQEENQREVIKEYIYADGTGDLFQPFDLEKGPLYRLKLFKTSEGYALYSVMHHMITDGVSSEIMFKEFISIYDSLKNKKEITLEPISLQYKDFAFWQNDVLQSDDINEDRDYWINRFKGKSGNLQLPSKQTRPRIRTSNGRYLGTHLTEDLTSVCYDFSNNNNGSLFTTLLALWNVLFYKYTSKEEIVLGTSIAGRNHPELEGQIGCYINVLTLLNEVNGDLSFQEFYEKVKETTFQAFEHQMYPFNTLIRDLKAEKDISRNNGLYDVMLFLQNFEDVQKTSVAMSDEETAYIKDYGYRITKLDIEIAFYEKGKHLKIMFKYNPDVYSYEEATGYMNDFKTFAAALLNNPDAKINDIGILPEAQQQAILEEYNDTKVTYEEKTIVDLFSAQVQETPENVAVRFEETTYSYAKFDQLSNQLGRYLIEKYDIQNNDLVGVHLDRSEKLPLAIMGILKSGAGYIPLGIDYPKERVDFIKKDAKLKIILDAAEMETFFTAHENYSNQAIQISRSLQDIAYCIYTSGSTGNPKGVVNMHGGLANRLLWMQDYLEVAATDTFLQKTPYTFDVSVWEFLLPIMTGSTLVVAKPEGHKDPAYLQEIINKENVNIVHFVPSMLGVFLQYLKDTDENVLLKHVVCSGEELPARMVNTLKELFENTRIHNLYGPTEAAIDVTAIDVTDEDLTEGVSIGKPVANTRIYIVDEGLNPQPVGIPGELLIAGIQVAKGYLNLPELTADRFITDPFKEGERVYKTGDIASWNENGTIRYIGRKDNQVKIRGNRIELGEIETKMRSYEAIENAAVLVKKSENTHKYLLAFVLPNESYNEDEFYAYLENCLPEYMIPNRIITLDEFPLTSSGKINRKAFPAVDELSVQVKKLLAPRNELEEKLAVIWEEVLEHSAIGVQQSFFRIGGDSILSIRLLGKINNEFEINLSIAQLYESNTIEELANLIIENGTSLDESQQIKTEIKAEIAILKNTVLANLTNPEEIEDIFPMTDIQKGMVVLSELNPEAGVYHDQFVFQIPAINVATFKEAFTRLIWKHATLRTHFNLTDYEKGVQIVKKEIDFTIDHRSIKELNSKEQEAYIYEYMLSERKNPFKVNAESLWRISLFEISETASIFLFQFHHAILDGWSLASMNTELFQIYRKLENKEVVEIEQLKITNKDAIVEELYDKQNSKITNFWKSNLDEYKKLDIFKNNDTYKIFTKTYNPEFRKQLEATCHADGISLKTVIYGAFAYALNLVTYDDDFILGMLSNNRPVLEDGDKLLGCFLNTIPVRNKFENTVSLSLSEYFVKVEENLTDIKKNERLTLYEISNLMGEKSANGSPFFDVMFNYINFHIYNELELHTDTSYKEAQEDDLDKESFVMTNTAFDFTASVLGDSLSMTYKLKKEFKNEVTIAKVHQYIETLLNTYVAQNTTKLKTIDFISEEEKDILINNILQLDATPETVIDLFTKQVEKTPNATALVYEGNTVTYKELDAQSNKIAQHLQQNYKITANDFVGMLQPVSHWSIISIVAILKSGAAYVPIDAELPLERMQYLVNETKIKALLTLSGVQENIAQLTENIVKVDTLTAEENEVSITLPTDAESLAYVIFTSGSTGKPKGVMVSHANIVDYSKGLFKNTPITASKSFALMSNIATDLGNTVLFGALLSGGSLHLPKKETLLQADAIHEYFDKHTIDCIKIVPSHWNALTKNDELLLPKQLIIFGGETLPVSYISAIKEKNDAVKIINHYGPTETTIGKLLMNINSTTKYDSIPIGKPFSETTVYVVDKDLKRSPVGVPGELLIGGKGVTKGYLNNPALTEKFFIQNPFTTQHQKVYKTGDIVRMLPDGNIEFIGRKDNQIKIRGHRIELGEIEARIQRSGLVENAVVLLKTTDEGRKYIVSYVLAKEGYSSNALYAYLENHLPEYMHPSRINVLEEFPLTANGKINRKKLAEIEQALIDQAQIVLPRTETETLLSNIWKKILEQQEISIDDNFFRIGGDSLLIIKMKHEIEATFHQAINIVDLFNHKTIEEQALLFEGLQEPEEVQEIDEIKF